MNKLLLLPQACLTALGIFCAVCRPISEGITAGLGVALVLRIYVEKETEEGRLVTPWPEAKKVSSTQYH